MKDKLLLTGSNGFLGKNIHAILATHYDLITLDRADADICCDLSREVCSINSNPDIVLHAAGKAHIVPKTAEESKLFFDINLQGTINLCQALEQTVPPKAFIFISTVAVYGRETGENISETHPLQGDSPYAMSKIQAEAYLTEWCAKHDVKLGILRPSLIAGPNPPGNLGAMIKGIKSGKYLRIGKGDARKSVLMVQDIAHLVPLIVEKGGIYNVCDSHHPQFKELEKLISLQLHKSKVLAIPLGCAWLLAKVGDLMGKRAPINTDKLAKITHSLTFNNDKAKSVLNWEPSNVLEHFKID